MKALAAVLSFLLLLVGVGMCLLTDLVLRPEKNLPKGVDPGSWDVYGSAAICIGAVLLIMSVISIIKKEEVPNEQPRRETLIRWP